MNSKLEFSEVIKNMWLWCCSNQTAISDSLL